MRRSRIQRTVGGDVTSVGGSAATDYSLPLIVADRHDWKYFCVTHEYIFAGEATNQVKLPGVSVAHYEDGGSRADKYDRDIHLLTGALRSEPDNPRTMYYLAQSYRDTKQFERALDWYEKRVLVGGWAEETWSALYQLGRVQELLDYDWRVILNSYLQAFNFRPSRLESVYRVARFYREREQWSLGYHFARLCTEYGYPDDILFIERPVYEYLLPFEYAVCCFHTGRVEEARRITGLLEEQKRIPPELLGTLKSLQ